MEIKHLEAEDMKKEMDEIQIRKHLEHDELRSDVSESKPATKIELRSLELANLFCKIKNNYKISF